MLAFFVVVVVERLYCVAFYSTHTRKSPESLWSLLVLLVVVLCLCANNICFGEQMQFCNIRPTVKFDDFQCVPALCVFLFVNICVIVLISNAYAQKERHFSNILHIDSF